MKEKSSMKMLQQFLNKNNIEKIQKIIEQGPKVMQDPLEDEELVDRRNEYCQKKTKELNIDRYSCQICDKLFRAPHYVEKHILNKHENKVYDKVDKKRFDELLFDNFIKNPSKFFQNYKSRPLQQFQ